MITLYAFGPQFSLPDPSPFVTKAEVLLKMSKLPYEIDLKGFRKAPKGKLPYIKDDGELIADSTFIRRHLDRKHKIDFDRGLSAEQKAIAWAFEKLAEDNLYWAIVDARWMIDANFDKGPRRFFDVIPAPVRALVVPMIRRQVRKNLHAHGMGRHSRSEIESIATQDIDAMAAYLGQKSFFMGAEPTGVDATIFAFAASALCPQFDTPLRAAAERHENLRRYVGRMTARYYPERGELAGCKAAA
jgi:glutathione S-transferase